MKVQVFASLKDFFKNEFELRGQVEDIKKLHEELLRIEPAAENILKRCRYAVKDEFVAVNYQLKENDTVFVIPPSSGG